MTNIRTKIIEGKQTILIVDGLPENKANEFKFGGMWMNMVRWKFISTIENLSGDVAHDLVGQKDKLTSPLRTFHLSLHENGVFTRNPNEKPNTRDYSPRELENDNSKYWKREEKWQEAEAKVFSPSTLIFVKQK